MYCQMCGRPPSGGGGMPCCVSGGKSLVKRNDSAARTPMVIVGRSGPFQISQSELGRIWPGGVKRAQEQGNRVLNANDIIGRPYESSRERDSCYLALDWLKSRAVLLPRLTSSGFNQASIFDQRVENLRNSFDTGDPTLILAGVDALEEFFESLDKLFLPGQGIGRNVAYEVMDMGLETAPLIADVPDALFNIIRYMWRMTSHDSNTIHRMFRAISPQDEQGLRDVAIDQLSIGENTEFTIKLLATVLRLPEDTMENLIQKTFT